MAADVQGVAAFPECERCARSSLTASAGGLELNYIHVLHQMTPIFFLDSMP